MRVQHAVATSRDEQAPKIQKNSRGRWRSKSQFFLNLFWSVIGAQDAWSCGIALLSDYPWENPYWYRIVVVNIEPSQVFCVMESVERMWCTMRALMFAASVP
eukprot:6456942-Amphidinium_carterae.1